MARKKIESIVCDRCDRVVEEIDADAGASIPEDEGLSAFVLESKFGNATFDDLCEKCDKRVADLIAQVLMESKEAKKDEKKAESKSKDQPKDEEKKVDEVKAEVKTEKISSSKTSKDGFSDFA